MSNKTVYLVTGANRGIGLGLVSVLAARPDAIVFAGARDPAAQSLKDLAAKHPNLHPIKFVVNDKANNEEAIAEIKKTAGQLDVVIPNAGVAKYVGPVSTTPPSEYRDHWEINTLGTIVLFQAAQELLLASPTGAPIFAYISTGAGSISRYFSLQATPYGSSKAAANFIVKALDAENPTLVVFAISPGWVATDMGNPGAAAAGLSEAPISVAESVEGVLSRIDGATKEKSSGRFWNFKPTFGGMPWDLDQDEIPW
ncbi:hypothetical protein FB45DRAFT_987934 [Roridomyces roridus]|uniref:NAD(P)-binding protein n=1 Tax=Roridomyces roridus TaxID=1738132 RepID=A0AAD7CC16_9AGAR|nr:hypothetical protein FB45DRAFT_987934 [Roridomyces roridus]